VKFRIGIGYDLHRLGPSASLILGGVEIPHEKGLIVVTPEGEVVRSEPIPGDHRQPEGVAITPDSILLVSDEANVKPPAITLYRWRR